MMPNATGLFLKLDMAEHVICSVDGGYSTRVPIIAPRQIARNCCQLQANQPLPSIRMQIEHNRIPKSVSIYQFNI